MLNLADREYTWRSSQSYGNNKIIIDFVDIIYYGSPEGPPEVFKNSLCIS